MPKFGHRFSFFPFYKKVTRTFYIWHIHITHTLSFPFLFFIMSDNVAHALSGKKSIDSNLQKESIYFK